MKGWIGCMSFMNSDLITYGIFIMDFRPVTSFPTTQLLFLFILYCLPQCWWQIGVEKLIHSVYIYYRIWFNGFYINLVEIFGGWTVPWSMRVSVHLVNLKVMKNVTMVIQLSSWNPFHHAIAHHSLYYAVLLFYRKTCSHSWIFAFHRMWKSGYQEHH